MHLATRTVRARRAVATALVAIIGASLAPGAAAAQPTPPPDLAVVCPEAPRPTFRDVAGEHAAAIGCLEHLGLTSGSADRSRFEPQRPVTRAQMASFLDRFVTLVDGSQLPAGPDRFGDDDGDVHEPAIDRLAAVAIVRGIDDSRFAPRRSVSRAQMASFVTRTLDHLDGPPAVSLPPAVSAAAFPDAVPPHADAIAALAATGIVQGRADGTYGSSRPITREQMASFLARAAAYAAERGLWRPGGDPVDPNDPVDPTDPSDPVDPVDPVDPTDPVDSTDPSDPALGMPLTPSLATVEVGTIHEIRATAPSPDVTVLVEVYERSPGEAVAYELYDFVPVRPDGSGTVSFRYASSVRSDDLVVACVVEDASWDVCVPDPTDLDEEDRPRLAPGSVGGYARVVWVGGVDPEPEPELARLGAGPFAMTGTGGAMNLSSVGFGFGEVLVTGVATEAGALEIADGDLRFPRLEESLEGLRLTLDLEQVGPAAGTWTDDGHVDITGQLRIVLRGFLGSLPVIGADGRCGIPPFDVTLTTGTSRVASGQPLLRDGTLRLVDDAVTIPAISGCGELPGFGNVDELLNEQIDITGDRSAPGAVAIRLPFVLDRD